MTNNKVLVIGLDGATWSLLRKWIYDNHLPTLKHLINNGAYGRLRSVIPPVTAPAWVSFATGKNPGKHGIFEFRNLNGRLINSLCVKEERVWDIISKKGLSVCLINVPVTYPPRPINGIMISSFLTPLGKKDYVYPPTILKEIEGIGYRIDLPFKVKNLLHVDDRYFLNNRVSLYREVLDIMEKRYKTTLHLMKKKRWDFFMVVFKETDVIQHLFWNSKNTMLKFYVQLDSYLSDIIEFFKKTHNYNEKVYIIILSDHGFGPSATKSFNLYGWFLRNYPSLLINSNWHLIKRLLIKKVYMLIHPILMKLGIFKKADYSKIKTRISYKININNRRIIKIGLTIYIPNVKPILLKKIVEELREVKDRDGKRIFKGVWLREKIYHGYRIESLPHIFMLLDPEYELSWEETYTLWKKIKRPKLPGDHQSFPEGILMMQGEGIKRGYNILSDISIYDVAPTILYLLGLEIPSDMDGHVIIEAFEEDYIEKHPVTISDKFNLAEDLRLKILRIRQNLLKRLK